MLLLLLLFASAAAEAAAEAAAAAHESTIALSAARTAADLGLWAGSGAQQLRMRSSSSGGHQGGRLGLFLSFEF